jgi:hypothetical protein
MRYFNTVWLWALGAGLLGVMALTAQEEAKARVVWDFTKNGATYGYEKWQDLGTVATKDDTGWTLDGNAGGGFGIFYNDLLDVEAATAFRVTFIPLEGHSDGELMFKFHAADGKQAVWRVKYPVLETGTETTLEFDLSAPTEKVQEEPIDRGIIRQIQLQGSFNPEKRVHLKLVKFEAVSPPVSLP